jgi:hypothetical protein
MSLFVIQLNRAVNAIGPWLELVLEQLACGFERRLYTDWDAPVYADLPAASPDGRRVRNGRAATAVIRPS